MGLRFAVPPFAVCISFIALFAQQTGSPAAAAGDAITLDVVVTDKAGKPVPGLEQGDFTVIDNKRSQQIQSFRAVEGRNSADGPPAEVILLLDEANTTFTRVGFEREQVEKFLKRDGGELSHPVSLAYLTDSGVSFGSAPTEDGNALAAELNQSSSSLRTIGRREGIYGAEDRIQLSLQALQQIADKQRPRPGRKLLVWISPGWAILANPNLTLTDKAKQGIFQSIVGIADGLIAAGLTVSSVDPLGMSDAGGFRTFEYKSYLKGVKTASQAQIGNLALQVIATQSGGRVLNSGNDITAEIAACVADTDAFYAVSIAVSAGDGPNGYHALEVKVDKPGLIARTRAGYYAQP